MSPSLFQVQMFPGHIKHFLLVLFLDLYSFQSEFLIPLNQWSCAWWARFDQLKAEILLAVICSSIALALKKAALFPPEAGRTVFFSRLVGIGSPVGYYYCSDVYEDLNSGGFRIETYGENIMTVTTKTFLKWPSSLLETATHSNMMQNPLLIFQAPFFERCYVNDGQCLADYDASESEKLPKERMSTIVLY